MADLVRIKDIETETETAESYDYFAIDSANKGTRRIRFDSLIGLLGNNVVKQDVTTFGTSIQVNNSTTLLSLQSNSIVPSVSIILPVNPSAGQRIIISFGNNSTKADTDVFTNNLAAVTASQGIIDPYSAVGTVIYHKETIIYQFLDGVYRRVG